ncbi:MAG: hypothetical protein IIC73_05030 [Armatimonadetes bacterium]|nr:hypothetical protein [Armatimonadota bacterium]
MKIRAVTPVLMVFCGLAVAGCASTIFETFDIQGKSLSLDAKQRIVVSTQKGDTNNPTRNIVCAEPSPDALVAISQAAGAQANIIGKGGGALSFSLTESAASMGIRTATIQLLRDVLYRACEAYLNGAVNEFGYGLILTSIDDVMITLLAIEGLTKITPAAQVAIGGTASSSAQGSQSVQPTDSETDDAAAGGSSSEGSATATTGSTTPVFSPVSNVAVGSQDVAVLAEAIRKIARKDPPGSSMAGACLMWISVTKLEMDNFQHTKMLDYCDAAFALYKSAVDGNAAPSQ